MDMLIKLYELESTLAYSNNEYQSIQNLEIRKPFGYESDETLNWVENNFSPRWKSETSIALHQNPTSCYLAFIEQKIAGFACFNSTALGMFGPTGVSAMYRGKGLGTALLLRCLLDMKSLGYAYAVIGGVGPSEFYSKMVNATKIPNSEPGIYQRITPTN